VRIDFLPPERTGLGTELVDDLPPAETWDGLSP